MAGNPEESISKEPAARLSKEESWLGAGGGPRAEGGSWEHGPAGLPGSSGS